MSERNLANGEFARSGACLCGTVTITIAEPAQETYHCHCSMCRRASGSLFQTFSVYPKSAVQITGGADQLRVYESSPGVSRKFCGRCGCQVVCEVDGSPESTFVNSGVLVGGAHPGHPPGKERHIYVADKVPWLHIGDDLPKFDQ